MAYSMTPMTTAPTPPVCDHCKGTKLVEVRLTKGQLEQVRCPVCGGTGQKRLTTK